MEHVKNHDYVKNNEDAYPIIHEVMNFLEDMNEISNRNYEVHATSYLKLSQEHHSISSQLDNHTTHCNAQNSS